MRNVLRGPWVLALLLASGVLPAARGQELILAGAHFAALPAQAAAPASGTPQGTAAIATKLAPIDIGGIKLGMPTKDAVAALKGMIGQPKILTTAVVPPFTEAADAPKGNEQVTADAVGPTGDKERIAFISTQPPNPNLVRWIKRKVDFVPGSGPNFDATLNDLRKKYGPESLVLASASNERINTMLIRWLFDANGKPLHGTAAQQELDCTEGGTAGTAACATLTVLEILIQADGVKNVYGLSAEVESYLLNKSARDASRTAKP